MVCVQAECGHQFTSRLEGMFKDMELSKSLMKGYKEHEAVNTTGALPRFLRACFAKLQKAAVASSVELNVTVLTTGFWPVPTVPDCTLPPVAAKVCINNARSHSLTLHAHQAQEAFTAYYTHIHSGRRLTWQTNLVSFFLSSIRACRLP